MTEPITHISLTSSYSSSPWKYWSRARETFKNNKNFGEFCDFVQMHLSIVASSACCERAFYRQNIHVPPQRAKKKKKSMIARLTIASMDSKEMNLPDN